MSLDQKLGNNNNGMLDRAIDVAYEIVDGDTLSDDKVEHFKSISERKAFKAYKSGNSEYSLDDFKKLNADGLCSDKLLKKVQNYEEKGSLTDRLKNFSFKSAYKSAGEKLSTGASYLGTKVGDIKQKVQDMKSSDDGFLKSAYKSAGEKLSAGASYLGTKVGNIKQKVEGMKSNDDGFFKSAYKSAGEKLSTGASYLGTKLGNIKQKVQDMKSSDDGFLRSAYKSAGEKLSAGASKLKLDKVKSALSSANARYVAGGLLGTGATYGGFKIQQNLPKIKEAVSNSISAVSDGISAVADKTIDLGYAVAGKAADLSYAVADKAVDLGQGVANAYQSASTWVTNVGSDVAGVVSGVNIDGENLAYAAGGAVLGALGTWAYLRNKKSKSDVESTDYCPSDLEGRVGVLEVRADNIDGAIGDINGTVYSSYPDIEDTANYKDVSKESVSSFDTFGNYNYAFE
jgi:Sec-independent protein translocase protein TatA